jgi:hypothetical protein
VQPVCTDFIGPWAAVAVAAYMQVQLATRHSVYEASQPARSSAAYKSGWVTRCVQELGAALHR